MKIEKQKVCSQCNALFSCYSSDCWCNNLPMIMPLDPSRNCSCPNCLKNTIQKKVDEYMNDLNPRNLAKIKALGKAENPVEGIDYYINENKLFVFTKWYHLRRGNCCKNNCTNCPYKTLNK